MIKGPAISYEQGEGPTRRQGGEGKAIFTPTKKGGGGGCRNSLSHPEGGGGHNKFLGSFNMGYLGFSHTEGAAPKLVTPNKEGGQVLPCLEGGAKSFGAAIFPF